MDDALQKMRELMESLEAQVTNFSARMVTRMGDVSLNLAQKGRFDAASAVISEAGLLVEGRETPSQKLIADAADNVVRTNVDALSNLSRTYTALNMPKDVAAIHGVMMATVGAFNTRLPEGVAEQVTNEGAMAQFHLAAAAKKSKLSR